MNYQIIKEGLSDYNIKQVDIFISYIKQLETEKDKNNKIKAWWIKSIKEDELISAYKKVALDSLFIDGDTITLTHKKKLLLSYNYQAYKNKLLNVYPESTFDVQNVCDNDSFSFSKKSGKVFYSHDFGNPFDTSRKIIGCYCIIKNSRGEFVEFLDLEEIDKMKKVAKIKDIWNTWTSEMILKSVIKRACKRHFKDITTNIDKLDNEGVDFDEFEKLMKTDEKIETALEIIAQSTSLDKLKKFWIESPYLHKKSQAVSAYDLKREALEQEQPTTSINKTMTFEQKCDLSEVTTMSELESHYHKHKDTLDAHEVPEFNRIINQKKSQLNGN